jgi:hypothetical protein
MRGRLLAFALCVAATGGCADDKSDLERASLGIHAVDMAGRSADVACEQLPLLQGSRRFTTHVIDDRLTIEVIAEPSEITLRFRDDSGKLLDGRILPRGLLLNGGDEDAEIVQLGIEGKAYTVTLSMGCSP